uniref:Uncharacterized protein n=1 Tax=Zea mays TaxID=4577 RepID=A0A804NWA7_MAIZE
MRDLGAGEGPVAADEDGGRGEAVVHGVSLEVDVVERVADVGGELEARVPGRERGEGRVLGVPEEHGQRGRVRDELVGEEQRGAVGRRGGAEEARDGGVVAVAQHGEARGHVPGVAAERAAEDGGGVPAQRAAEGVGRGGGRGGGEAVRGGEVGGGGGEVLEGEEERQLREGVAERGERRRGGGHRGGGGGGVGRRRGEGGGRGRARRPAVPRRGCRSGRRHGGGRGGGGDGALGFAHPIRLGADHGRRPIGATTVHRPPPLVLVVSRSPRDWSAGPARRCREGKAAWSSFFAGWVSFSSMMIICYVSYITYNYIF